MIAPRAAPSGAPWRTLRASLRAFVARRVDDPADAEDLVQEIFLRVHARLHQLDDDTRLDAWIYRIARNVITDHHRARARRLESPLENADALAAPAPADPDARAELASCIDPLLARLPEPQRAALALTELGGLSQREAAARLGLSPSGMRSRVQRGRAALKALLLDCCAIELDRRRRPIDYACIRAVEAYCACEPGED